MARPRTFHPDIAYACYLICGVTTRTMVLPRLDLTLNGVGAKKLEKYGTVFLAVLNGAGEDMHPVRRKLAGKPAGDIFDRLKAAQLELANGPHGTEKSMSCNTSLLAKVAGQRPDSTKALERIIGEAKTERFGDAFLEILERN